jgi:hypothetical protein
MILKVALFVLFTVALLVLQIWNSRLRAENQQMLKFIKNEARYTAAHERILAEEEGWSRYYLPLEAGADTDRIKSNFMNEILKVANRNRLKPDSYDSEFSEESPFVYFHYSVTAFGKYVDIVRFFTQINRSFPFVYVTQYKMNKTGNKMVRLDLRMDILAKTLQ